MSIINAARSAYGSGLCPLPVRDDGSKAPAMSSWRVYQQTRPTIEQMRAWDFASRAGFGMVAGPVSNYAYTWDFDDAATFDAFIEAADACRLGDLVARIRTGYEDATPGGGRRWIVRADASVAWQDCTLARRPGREGEPAVKALIELPTFAILAPSNGRTHPSGRPYEHLSGAFDTIAAVTADEHEALLALARTFDQMPRPEAVRAPTPTSTTGKRPGDDFNHRSSWPQLLEPHGWTIVFTRGEVTYWRRPGKTFGVSATTNVHSRDLLYIFTSSTSFEPEKSYSKFAAYALLEHGGDFSKAASALAKQGYGEHDDPLPVPSPTPSAPATPCALPEAIAVFRRWLSLDDPTPLYAVAATLVANRAPGDPVWLLLVCAPSTGKTEILSAATGLPYVITAAKVTEASLLSGTSKRERVTGATGGLLRQIGDFGVLVVKDFTSVLAQNQDARAEAMAALREVYDGRWDRPVGTDGGRVLSWQGKCGLIGGVTPALDHYSQVTSALGDRFVLLRMPDAPVDDFGAAALRHGDQEPHMRRELRDALAGLVVHADTTRVNRPWTQDEQHRLIRLAAYTARARTAVVRDGYHHDVAYLPQVEGPGRLVKAYARLLGGLEAIGCDAPTAWTTLTRIAIDCAPALRTKVIRELVSRMEPARTSVVATAIQTATKTASRYLEDLSILKLADRHKLSDATNAPDLWQASAWLREYWPSKSGTEIYAHLIDGDAVPVQTSKSRTEIYPPAPQANKGGEANAHGDQELAVRREVHLGPTPPPMNGGDDLPDFLRDLKPDESDPIGLRDIEAPTHLRLGDLNGTPPAFDPSAAFGSIENRQRVAAAYRAGREADDDEVLS